MMLKVPVGDARTLDVLEDPAAVRDEVFFWR